MKKKEVSKMNTKRLYPISFLGITLVVFLLFISIGFGAMSTSLSINGSSAFTPVGLIRVMSIGNASLVGATEEVKSITPDAIKNRLDLNTAGSRATYTVVIKNLGQTDQVLDSVIEDMFSNNQMEYVFNGFDIGDVIEAGQEKQFTVTFKYKSNATAPLESRLNSNLRFVFTDYIPSDPLHLVFNYDGACTFNGVGNYITGNDCQDYWDKEYIDTGVYLYSAENWRRDYEIGFTIESYNASQNVNQAIFVNSKLEDSNKKWPGLVFRRDANKSSLEITQSINMGTKVAKIINNPTYPMDVKIMRENGIVTYSINGGSPVTLQDMTNFNQQFDITTWFGSGPNASGVPFRTLVGTLSHMYVKIGRDNAVRYNITFNTSVGTLTENSRQVVQYREIGTLPIPTTTEYRSFEGWYTDTTYTTRIDSTYVPTGDMQLYAKWSDTCIAEANGQYYTTLATAIDTEAYDGVPVTITLLDDLNDKVIIPRNKIITLDFTGHTISPADTTKPIIENSGDLTIVGGTFTTSGNTATVDNTSYGTIHITGGTFTSTGAKQAVYNNGGTMVISGNPTFTNTSSQRAAVHNLNNGHLTITGGTIVANNYSAIKNESGTLIIGTDDSTVDATTPSIQGKTYGIESAVNFTLYDGIAKGITAAVKDETKIVTSYQINNGTETIDNNTYHTLYLTQ